MNLEKLINILQRRNVDTASFKIGGKPKEKTYMVCQVDGNQEVFYFHNEQKYKLKVFTNESDAGSYLYDLILKDPKTRNKVIIPNLKVLKEKLNHIGVKDHTYALGKYGEEKFCILESESKWEVFASDRGNKNELQLFSNEHDACEYFYNHITGYGFIMNDLKR